MQPYLNKLPAALVDLFPQLAAAAAFQDMPARHPCPVQMAGAVGGAYREAEVSSSPDRREPFAVDPGPVERGLRGHAVA